MPFCLEPARVKRRTHRQISIIQTDSIHASASTAPDGELDALKHSIARLGLLSPILVRARGNGYELVAGARRLAACRALGMEELECIVLPALNEECLLAALCENSCRRTPVPQRERQLRRDLERFHGYAPADLDALAGRLAAPEPPAVSRRSAHGYIRDGRLIVNAAQELVSGLRATGMDARLYVRAVGDGMKLEISVPCGAGTAVCGAMAADADEEPMLDNGKPVGDGVEAAAGKSQAVGTRAAAGKSRAVGVRAAVGECETAGAGAAVGECETAGAGAAVGECETAGTGAAVGECETAGAGAAVGKCETAGTGVAVGECETAGAGAAVGKCETAGTGVEFGKIEVAGVRKTFGEAKASGAGSAVGQSETADAMSMASEGKAAGIMSTVSISETASAGAGPAVGNCKTSGTDAGAICGKIETADTGVRPGTSGSKATRTDDASISDSGGVAGAYGSPLADSGGNKRIDAGPTVFNDASARAGGTHIGIGASACIKADRADANARGAAVRTYESVADSVKAASAEVHSPQSASAMNLPTEPDWQNLPEEHELNDYCATVYAANLAERSAAAWHDERLSLSQIGALLADRRMDNANAHVHSLANATENRDTERSDPDIPSTEYAKCTTDEYRPRRSARINPARDSTATLCDKRVINNEHIENATQIPSDCLNADTANTAGQSACHQKTRAVRRQFRRKHACNLKDLGDECAQKSHEKSIAIDEEAPISAEVTNCDPVQRLPDHSASRTNMNAGSPKADPIAQTPSASNAEPREANGSSAPEQRDSPGETIACNPAVSGCAAARSRAVGSVRLRAESTSDMDRLMDQLLGEELAHMRKKHAGGLTLSL